MKKKILSFITLTLTVFIIIELFILSTSIKNTIIFSFKLWFYNIVPSLLPFLIISNFLINIGFVDFLSNLLIKPMNYLFKSPGEASFVFIISFLSGSPVNAKIIKDLLDKDYINEKDASKILCFTSFINPLFIINFIGILLLKNTKLAIIIIIVQIINNIIIALIFRNIYKCKKRNIILSFKKNLSNLNNNINNSNLVDIVSKGIISSFNTLINILGVITICLIILTIISVVIKTSPLTNVIMAGAIELTSGLNYLSLINIPIYYKLLLSIIFISFGGLSINFQIKNILKDYKIKYLLFYLSRIISIILSIIFVFLMKLVLLS